MSAIQFQSPSDTVSPYCSDCESAESPSSSSSIPDSPVSTSSPSLEQDEMSRIAPAPQPSNAHLIIVDPLSTGALLAIEATEQQIPIIRVFSYEVPDSISNHIPDSLKQRIQFVASFQNKHGNDVSEVVNSIKLLNVPILGVIAGCETGVECADAIAAALDCVNNNPLLSYYRRNKYEMGEQLRACDIRCVKQALVTELIHIQTFINQYFPIEPFKVIIKPVQSAGSDGVYLCNTLVELEEKFNLLMGAKNILGNENKSVVVQEFLEGQEYVVDAVSYNGVHKIMALWQYDKRAVNGAFCVYHGMRLMDSNEPHCNEMITYIRTVLDALNIRYGPSHSEVIVTKDGPVLVETGARLHGGEGSFIPITRACIGYDIITSSLLALQDTASFMKLPDRPILSHMYGAEQYFVSRVSGKWIDTQYLDLIQSLPSFYNLTWYSPLGSMLSPTIDCLTMPGSVILLHNDPKQLEIDIALFQQYNTKGFFLIESNEEN